MSYETLEMYLNKKEQPFLWMQLEKRTLQERVDELCEMLFKTVAAHIDERAAFLWEALLHAVDDLMLEPLMMTVKDFGREEIRIRDYVKDLDADALKLAQRRRRAALALEIYAIIPSFREVQEWDDLQRKKMPVKHQTLPGVKKSLWTEVASWWHDTRDETESSTLFDWFLGLEIAFNPEQNILDEIIRTHSDCMSAERLLACLLRVKQFHDNHRWLEEEGVRKQMRCRDVDNWLNYMLHAWIRRQKPMDVVNQLTALAPIAPYGEMAWDMLRSVAQPMGVFAQQVHVLKDFINPPGKFGSIFDRCQVDVSYGKLGQVVVEISVPSTPFGRDQGSVDAEYVISATQQLGEWVKHHSDVKIFVRIGFKSTIPGREFSARHEFWIV